MSRKENKMTNETQKYTITKRIAKHGRQAVVIVPSLLQEILFPGVLVEITFEIKNEVLKGGMK